MVKYICTYCGTKYVPNGSLMHDCPERQAHLAGIEEARRGSDYFEKAPKTNAYFGEKAKTDM